MSDCVPPLPPVTLQSATLNDTSTPSWHEVMIPDLVSLGRAPRSSCKQWLAISNAAASCEACLVHKGVT